MYIYIWWLLAQSKKKNQEILHKNVNGVYFSDLAFYNLHFTMYT